MKSKQVKVNRKIWDDLAAAAEARMALNPDLKRRWLARTCDMTLPDLLQDDRCWPLAFFTWAEKADR